MTDFTSVGTQFVQHYYTTFDSNRAALEPLYSDQSMLTFEEQQCLGRAQIIEKLKSLPFQTVKHQIVKCDCQPTVNNGVIVFVTGNLMVDQEQNPLKFAQVFHLAVNPNGQGYYCHNDLFRLNVG
uniref:Nuclear transport factor 2 n=1 Tax=Chromera velia CCMP2878 TaxID=1169474 RepID=A0A0G4I329_9ALVE|mmetsp:Transcript_54020/g.105660  ORF Transcript_54020/g.105660 Transcript_54020/m.105660 type:complete len:125 (-) Transcript_54020:605-979(-)|eukprot:Cvel_1738.t1-p1 / transcript=Cvel_1738.t1 / gene=Cvel_1738 / organism=Chromera_velia_CCMP2878 / gene_product=Nuclear transport factor 2, putative / transcript_product=Nuclear transport factor 2, putative / location=Cvel_scaffold63:70266-70637(-) / protein_length=124 / sequence_SO=supercontig / SO=protein_coding / is_pseudo=false